MIHQWIWYDLVHGEALCSNPGVRMKKGIIDPVVPLLHHAAPCCTMLHHAAPCCTMLHHAAPATAMSSAGISAAARSVVFTICLLILVPTSSGCWFGTFFIFPKSWDDDPI